MEIESGDTVRHAIYKTLNGGVAFNVIDINGEMALCDFFNLRNENEQREFKIDDLILVNKKHGGFRNPGEAM